MKKSLVFVISSMSMGGPQKSLIGLMERLNPAVFDINILVLDPSKCELVEFLPSHVRVIDTDPLLTAATLPRGRVRWAVTRLLLAVTPWAAVVIASHLVRGMLGLEGWQRVRQRIWRTASPHLPKITGTYDAAVGILGVSTYAVVDLVESSYKYHWVRSDSRVLGRLESIETAYFDQLSGALAVSGKCEEIFVNMYPGLRGRVRTYKNDIPTTMSVGGPGAVWPGGSTVKLLTTSRLDPLKGLDIAIEALSRLEKRGLDVGWVILGDGPERAQLEDQVEALGLRHRITLPGTVLDVGPYIAEADIYVHPSRAEGRSNAVEEARAAGKPVIVTNYPTASDQVTHNVDGIVCETDAIALARAIELLVSDPALMERLGSRAAWSYLAEAADANAVFRGLALGQIWVTDVR